jgi:hypothetical protein
MPAAVPWPSRAAKALEEEGRTFPYSPAPTVEFIPETLEI